MKNTPRTGCGRPPVSPGEKMGNVAVSISESLREKFVKKCKREKTTISERLRSLIKKDVRK